MSLLNKFTLFLVEGETDEQSLAYAMSKEIDHFNFHIIRTDITSDELSTVDNIEDRIAQEIGFFFSEKNHLDPEDIDYIVQITDTDGTFVNGGFVVEDSNVENNQYYDDKIITKKAENITIRNDRKSSILKYLSSKERIKCNLKNKEYNLKYRIYYMSCNLEHVLHNERNLSQEQKEELSINFRKKVYNNHGLLREIIFHPSIFNSTSYKESWEYIQKENNSLLRKCNFGYYFEEFVDV